MKNNKIHKILGVITRPGTEGISSFRYDALPKLVGMHELELKGYMDELEKDDSTLLVQRQDLGHFTRHYEPCRKAYLAKRYKEPTKWWVRTVEIAGVSGGIALLITTTIGALDNRQAPILLDSIARQTKRIDSLKGELVKDSQALASCLDSLNNLKSDSSNQASPLVPIPR